MAGDDDIKPMSDDEFEFYRKNGRLPTPQETGALMQQRTAAATTKQGGAAPGAGIAAGIGRFAASAPGALKQMAGEAWRKAITPPPPGQARTLGEAARQTGYGTGIFGSHEHPEVELAKAGYRDIKGGEYQKGLHELFGAGTEFLRPTLPAVGAGGLIPAARGLATMYAAGAVGKQLGPTVGLTPELGEDIGTLVGGARKGGREPAPRETIRPVEAPPPYRGPGPATPSEAAPVTPRPRGPRPGPVQGPKLPTAEESLNVPAREMFGKDYKDLGPDQKRAAASRMGGPAGEQPTPLPTIAPEAAERRVRDVGPAPGGVDQRSVNRDIQTLTATEPMKAHLLSDTFEQWKKATGTEKQVLADRINGMQSEMQTVPGMTTKAPEPSIFKPGETVSGWKKQEPMTREEAEAESAKRTAGRTARFGGAATGQPIPTGPIPTPAPAPAAPGGPGAAMPTVTPPLARANVPPAPAPTPLTPLPAANVPQGTIPPISLDEALRQATGQPPPPKPGVPLGEQLGKKE